MFANLPLATWLAGFILEMQFSGLTMRSSDIRSRFQHLHLQDHRGLESWEWSNRKADSQASELRVKGCGEDWDSPAPRVEVSLISVSQGIPETPRGRDNGKPGNQVLC